MNGVWGLRPQILPLLLLASCSSTPAPRHGIASLNPCTDAILAEVADPAQIAALSAYSRQPGQSSMDIGLARRLPSTGGTVEEVLALRPAVVLASTFTPPATRSAFARLGVPLAEFGIAGTVPESYAQIRRIAAIAGHPERGEALVARIEAGFAAAAPPRQARTIPALVWEGGGIVPGQGALISELLRRTGFSNFSAARGLGQAQGMPLEQVLADPPPVILVAGNAAAQENRLLRHPALAGLPGTRRFAFDPALLWCGGPTMLRATARLAAVRRSLPL